MSALVEDTSSVVAQSDSGSALASMTTDARLGSPATSSATEAIASIRQYPWASQPHLLLANQKDATLVQEIEHQLSQCLDATRIARYCSTVGPEIRLVSKLLYYLPTNVLARGHGVGYSPATLGEEYCDIRSVATQRLRTGNKHQRTGTKYRRTVATEIPTPVGKAQMMTMTAVQVCAEYAWERYSSGWEALARVARFRSPRIVSMITHFRSWGAKCANFLSAAESRFVTLCRATSASEAGSNARERLYYEVRNPPQCFMMIVDVVTPWMISFVLLLC